MVKVKKYVSRALQGKCYPKSPQRNAPATRNAALATGDFAYKVGTLTLGPHLLTTTRVSAVAGFEAISFYATSDLANNV